jgi:NAD(P)-dependent dehydrogenase (short-subunit alcohol dehydrogenase family)
LKTKDVPMRCTIAAIFSVLFAIPISAEKPQTPGPGSTKAVLVTGASTGIGRRITEKLAADGYFVYAGARKEEDLKALGAIKNVQAVRLDVTKPEDITAAVEIVKQGGRGLYGLVNNAGVGTYGSFVDMKPDEFDLVMAVNVYGPYRVTKAFAPLIVTQRGRIANIGSISGILAGPMLGAYSMSKHAIEAFTDSLAEQMAGLGVAVSVIEPGNYNSEISKNAIKRIGATPQGTNNASGRPISADRSTYKEPDEVADAVEKALFELNPKRRYMVVPNQHEAEITIKKQMEQLVQLNEGQPYAYDRDALVKMLEEELTHAHPRSN